MADFQYPLPDGGTAAQPNPVNPYVYPLPEGGVQAQNNWAIEEASGVQVQVLLGTGIPLGWVEATQNASTVLTGQLGVEVEVALSGLQIGVSVGALTPPEAPPLREGAPVVPAAYARHQMAGVLQAGLRVLDENQRILFVKYLRMVLPVDGTTFWVRADLASSAAIANIARMNSSYQNQPRVNVTPKQFYADGSIHYMTSTSQNEDDSSSMNRVIFTAENPVEDLNEVSPLVMYIGTWQGVRFSFSRRENFYQQAGLHHYAGDAVFSVMATQVIDNIGQISNRQIVSNSLPIWLSLLNPYLPVLGLGGLNFPVYPSFLVDQNIRPPYAAVHVYPESTDAIAGAAYFDRVSSQDQLVKERVRVTLYGFNNVAALDFINYVVQYCFYSEVMGVSNSPVPRDEKRTQVELGVLAQKKTVEFEVNYYQRATRDIARQLILSAFATVTPNSGDPPEDPGRWNGFSWNGGTTWS